MSLSTGISPTVEAKISQQLLADEYAKAAGLLAAKVIVPDPRTSGMSAPLDSEDPTSHDNTHYTKLVAGYQIDVHAQTCTCPWFEHNAEIETAIERIETEILLAATDKERELKVKALRQMRPFPGRVCKHLLAANHLAGLIDIHQEFAGFPPAIKRAAKDAFFAKERDTNLDILKTGDPEHRVVTVKRYQPQQPVPLPVPVIEVKGLLETRPGPDGKDHTYQYGVPLSKNGRPPARVYFLCDKDANGQLQAQATEARAKALFGEHYKVSVVVVPASACQFYRPLYTELPC